MNCKVIAYRIWNHLPYVVLTTHSCLLLIICFFFAQDLNICRIREIDDWLLLSYLTRTWNAFWINTDSIELIKGFFHSSYGPLYWYSLIAATFPFYFLDFQPGIVFTARLISLAAGIGCWIITIKLIRAHLTQNPILISIALIPSLLCSQILRFQSSIHPDTLALVPFILCFYYLLQDFNAPNDYKNFTKATIAATFAIAIKFTSLMLCLPLLTHLVLTKKIKIKNILIKNISIGVLLSGLLHLPIFHYEGFKYYIGRIIFLSQKAKEYPPGFGFFKTLCEKIEIFHTHIISIYFFLSIVIIGIIIAALNRKKIATQAKEYLYILSLACFIVHGFWVILTNHAIWIHYALINLYLLPIILIYIAIFIKNHIKNSLSCKLAGIFLGLLWGIQFIKSVKTELINFIKIPQNFETLKRLNLLKKINSILLTTHYQYKVIAVTPHLGVSSVSTYTFPTIEEIRVKHHCENLSHVEAMVLQTGFILHDTPSTNIFDYIMEHNYSSLFAIFYKDEEVTILIKKSITSSPK